MLNQTNQTAPSSPINDSRIKVKFVEDEEESSNGGFLTQFKEYETLPS
jgi:hypothetical protein